jgi:hypothetical protein
MRACIRPAQKIAHAQRVSRPLPVESNAKGVDLRTPAAALGLVLFAAAIVAPHAFWGGIITSDGYEHLAIAHSWLHGAGFVDPVQWHYYLAESPPLPAAAVRPPLISILAAIPLAAGATIPTVILVHATWAALIIGAVFLTASRFMRRRAAAAVALLVASFPPWATYLSVTPLSEVTAVGCYLLVLITASRVLTSPFGAMSCAFATLIAAMTRPNLSALALAVSVAVAIEVGPRAALRHRGLWTYLLAFTAGYLVLDLAMEVTTGVGLYAGYGIVTEIMGLEDAWRYDREFEGALAFVGKHADEILMRMQERLAQLFQSLCIAPTYHRIGWLAAPAILYGLIRPRDGVLAHRINAFSILGFGLILVANYSAFDADRYPLWVALPICLGGIAFLDAWTRRLARRPETDESGPLPTFARRTTAISGWLPLAVACWVAFLSFASATTKYPGSWTHYQIARSGQAIPSRAAPLRAICAHIDRNAVVASAIPWQVLYWCGNAGLRIPIEPESDAIRDRFMIDRNARYILLTPARLYSPFDLAAWTESVERSPDFLKRAAVGSVALYEYVGPTPRVAPWQAPPPLACAGLRPDCTTPPKR